MRASPAFAVDSVTGDEGLPGGLLAGTNPRSREHAQGAGPPYQFPHRMVAQACGYAGMSLVCFGKSLPRRVRAIVDFTFYFFQFILN